MVELGNFSLTLLSRRCRSECCPCGGGGALLYPRRRRRRRMSARRARVAANDGLERGEKRTHLLPLLLVPNARPASAQHPKPGELRTPKTVGTRRETGSHREKRPSCSTCPSVAAPLLFSPASFADARSKDEMRTVAVVATSVELLPASLPSPFIPLRLRYNGQEEEEEEMGGL